MDANSFENEHEGSRLSSDGQDLTQRESMLMAGKELEDWLSELDVIAKEIEVELISRNIGCYLIEVLEAVNKVLLNSSNLLDFRCSYLSYYNNLTSVLLIIYIEGCIRLNLTIVGLLDVAQAGNPEII
ncbi:hypothetical protein L1987_37667 [Smallanthus sonchifolius]|uniref:Uncharacterized protein n=1 Tax=Smallanthus sonchifolius TaxID=185202 RepID=A0ACB9HGI7_9ASTR|nr:hypothetical protein L1987_37667 [Smallanthus sonchifolius]